MQEGILRGILNGERAIVTHAQAVFGMRSNRVEAREYLNRYVDAEGAMRSLEPVLHAPGITMDDRIALDLHCLECTFSTLAEAPKGTDYLHFVNIEPMTLIAPAFWTSLPRWIERMEIEPGQVVMEFTEAHSIHDMDELQRQSLQLRNHGFRVAVDDLGSGVASLSHMARLAPDFIKADRSLVSQVHRRPYQAALLNALSHFAQRMCIGFIAEGIETPEELQAVVDADVPWGQGFVFGQPQPVGALPLSGASAS